MSEDSKLNNDLLKMLKEICEKKQPVFLSGDHLDITFQTQITRVDKDRIVLDNRVKPNLVRSFQGSKQFFLQCRMVRLQTDTVEPAGTEMVFIIRDNSIIAETRAEERLVFSPDEKVICELLNPYDQKTRLAKMVLDMSPSGLSIRTSMASKLFTPGTYFNELRVLIDGKAYAQSAGKIVYSRKLMDDSGKLSVQVGVKLEPHDSSPESKRT